MRAAALLLALLLPAAAGAEPPDLDALVEALRAEHAAAGAAARARAGRLEADVAELRAEAERLRREAAAAEAREQELAARLDGAQASLADLRGQLQEEAAALEGVYGSARETASRLADELAGDITSADHGARLEPLEALADSSALPPADALESLWLTLLDDIAATGTVARFEAPVVLPDGRAEPREVLRLGAFGAVAGGDYLAWREDIGALAVLAAQPGGRWERAAQRLQEAQAGMVVAGVDPSRGVVLERLTALPGPAERVAQGGPVGYLILALGLAGAAVALYRLIVLTLTGRRVERQLAAPEAPRDDNPLGRVLGLYRAGAGEPPEVLESRLDEAVLGEVAALERGRALVRLLAAVAPLLGLLGTVVGMIETFQAISVFGTGDPKLMAGGISQALVTTMLGLAVAVPLLFLHALIASRSRALVGILDQQSAGLVAARLEGEQTP